VKVTHRNPQIPPQEQVPLDNQGRNLLQFPSLELRTSAAALIKPGEPPKSSSAGRNHGIQLHDSESLMHPDNVQLYVLCRETGNRIASLRRAVDEGHRLDEAANFARYVLFSGICTLLQQFPQGEPLPCDGHLLQHQANELLRAAQDRYRTGDTTAKLDWSYLDAINRKLDLIAGQVARFPPPNITALPVASTPDGNMEKHRTG